MRPGGGIPKKPTPLGKPADMPTWGRCYASNRDLVALEMRQTAIRRGMDDP